jgi:hypothetical protein
MYYHSPNTPPGFFQLICFGHSNWLDMKGPLCYIKCIQLKLIMQAENNLQKKYPNPGANPLIAASEYLHQH